MEEACKIEFLENLSPLDLLQCTLYLSVGLLALFAGLALQPDTHLNSIPITCSDITKMRLFREEELQADQALSSVSARYFLCCKGVAPGRGWGRIIQPAYPKDTLMLENAFLTAYWVGHFVFNASRNRKRQRRRQGRERQRAREEKRIKLQKGYENHLPFR